MRDRGSPSHRHHPTLSLRSPAGFGVACHLGVLTELPCIGVAKKLLQVDGLENSALHKQKVSGALGLPVTALGPVAWPPLGAPQTQLGLLALLTSLLSCPEADPLSPGHCLPSASGSSEQWLSSQKLPTHLRRVCLPFPCLCASTVGPRPPVPGDKLSRSPSHASHLLPSLVLTATCSPCLLT